MTCPSTAVGAEAVAEPPVKTTLDDGVLELLINRPSRLNAVTSEVLDELAVAVELSAQNSDVRVIVLSGVGRAFCSGADLGVDGAATEQQSAATIDAANRLVEAMQRSPRPVITAVKGPAVGVGVSIALAADLTIVRADAYFMLPFVGIGLMPDGGATALLAAAAGRATAMRLALLGERLSAVDAERLGLIARVYDVESFDRALGEVVEKLRYSPSDAVARTKHAINTASLGELEAAFLREREGQLALLASADFVEARAAFSEKRAPIFATSSNKDMS